ncbi:MAG: hypothetical protein ACFFD6_01805 [Candidatus Thorarchaeota archaeon]
MNPSRDEKESRVTPSFTDRHGTPVPLKVWGFEGCGAMWTFYTDQKRAQQAAQKNQVHEMEIEEAYFLDTTRRREMGYPAITFEQFLECIEQPPTCATDDPQCD